MSFNILDIFSFWKHGAERVFFETRTYAPGIILAFSDGYSNAYTSTIWSSNTILRLTFHRLQIFFLQDESRMMAYLSRKINKSQKEI